MSATEPIVCPRCGHARTASDDAPAWECPRCGIVYRKYRAHLDHARRLTTPPGSGEAMPHWTADGSIWSLVAANLIGIGAAIYQGWSMSSLMALYWGQSLVIGVANVLRLLALDRFSTENLRIDDHPVDPTPSTKRRMALFFAIHYGFFHVLYLVFLREGASEALFPPWFWICIATFAANHLWSYRYNRDLDRRGTPNIGTLMFTPYLRILPMHLTIIVGSFLTRSVAGVLLFGTLKAAADVAMHVAEHAQLRKVRAGEPPGQVPQDRAPPPG